ncbi:MAG: heat-shock protein Hsp20 [Candidatus Tectimicrobiota bacterium]|nr:MAG: heat-shock protein Hsp20 [Candidatus Tectomicrobia bacterium]
MALVRWSPLPGLETLRQEIDRLFETHLAEFFGDGEMGRVTWLPRMDVRETDTAFIVEVDLPGMAIEDIDVHVEGNTLVIAGERKLERAEEHLGMARYERAAGRFHRAYTLPAPVVADKVEARYCNGVLTVTVPKAEAAKTKRIAIQAA